LLKAVGLNQEEDINRASQEKPARRFFAPVQAHCPEHELPEPRPGQLLLPAPPPSAIAASPQRQPAGETPPRV